MKEKPSSLTLWLKEWARLQTRRRWLEPRPVYVAAGLALAAALVMLMAVNGVRQSPAPGGDLTIARQQAAEQAAKTLPVADVTKPQSPAAVPVTESVPARSETPVSPLAGEISLAFGWQLQPLYGDWRYHPGVDIAAAAGSPVKAVWAGRVTGVYDDGRYGLAVTVDGGGYSAFYGSLSVARVDKGQAIAAGMVIGTVGQARDEPYPHLHLALKKGDSYIDPSSVLRGAK